MRVLEVASKELRRLNGLKAIFHDTSELVSRHNRLVRQKIIPGVGPTRVRWSGITQRAHQLMTMLAADEYKFPALTVLQVHSSNPSLKEELTRLLHIVSSLICEYTEILTVLDQYPQTIIVMCSLEIEHLDETAARVSRLIQESTRAATRP